MGKEMGEIRFMGIAGIVAPVFYFISHLNLIKQ